MSKAGKWWLAGGMVVVAAAGTGCVSRDEFLRVDFARRQAVERVDALERDLQDERNRAGALEKEAEGLRRERDTQTALAETLQAENARLDSIRKALQDQLAAASKLGDVRVVEVKLPPELDKALQEFAAQYPDMIEYDPQRGAVRWKSDLTFALGSDEVRETVRASLKAFADIVNSPTARAFEVVVVGHTDTVPISSATARKHPTNWHLSVHRSVAVMFALNQFGVDFRRIGCMGYGEYRPTTPNPPRGGSEPNRRVEIFLVKSTEGFTGTEAVVGTPAEAPAVVTKGETE